MATKKATTKAPAGKKGFDSYVEDGSDQVDPQLTGNELSAPRSAIQSYSNKPIIDADDVFIPKLRLAQGLTSEVTNGYAKSGQWLVTGEDPMDKPTIIPMMMTRRRELRDSDDSRTIYCRSGDAVQGVGDPGGDCASCPMAKWVQGKGKNAKNTPPPCTFIYSYIVYVVETDSLAILEFYRTSIPAGKMLNTMIMQKGLGTFAAVVSSSGSKGPRGSYYTPVINGAKVADKVLKAAQAKAADVFGPVS